MFIRTAISSHDTNQNETLYRGVKMLDLISSWQYEEVAYLILFGERPSEEKLYDFMQKGFSMRERLALEFQKRSHLPSHPIHMFQSLLASQQVYYDDWSLINQLFVSMSSFYSNPVLPVENLPAQMHFMMTSITLSDTSLNAVRALMILYAENVSATSTLVLRSCASAGATLPSSLSAAVGALSGYRHGGAIAEVMPMLRLVRYGEVENFVAKKIANKEMIPGFGHSYFKSGDPRAAVSYAIAESLVKDERDQALFSLAKVLEQAVLDKKSLKPNVDYYAALALHFLGVADEKMLLFFALSRLLGWVAHYKEQRLLPELFFAQSEENQN